MRVQRERSHGDAVCPPEEDVHLRIDSNSRKLWYEIHLDLFYKTAGLLIH